MNTPVLSEADLAHFEQQGYVCVPEAFPRISALGMQDFMWSQLQTQQGILRDDRATWIHDAKGLNKTAEAYIYKDIAAPRMCGAIDQLLGAGTWDVPKSWGGFLVTFPRGDHDTWELSATNWHWDVKPSERLYDLNGLFIFMLFSHIQPRGGGTLLLSGSHCLVNHYAEMRRSNQKPADTNSFRLSHPYIAELAGMTSKIKDRDARIQMFMGQETDVDGVSVRVIQITGEPGDAFLCHPSLFHAASANHAEIPRFMRVKGLNRNNL